MGTVQKFLMGVVGVWLVTTAVLPEHKTAQVIDSLTKGVARVGHTSITGQA